MTLERTDSPTDILLVLRATARVAEAEALAEALKPVLEVPAPLVTLDLSGIDGADISFYQILLAFQKSLTSRGRHLLVKALPRDHLVLETARLVGLPLEYHLTLVGETP